MSTFSCCLEFCALKWNILCTQVEHFVRNLACAIGLHLVYNMDPTNGEDPRIFSYLK